VGERPTDVAHVVRQDEAGKTLGAVVRTALGLPWSKAQGLVETRRVTVGGEVVTDAARRLAAGEVVGVHPEARKVTRGMLEPERVVYVDADVLVVDKPAGLMTVPFEGERDTLADRARVLLRRAHGGDELGVVHRLDKDTSGLVVFARGLAAKKALARQIEAHTTRRVYDALVHGVAQAGTIESWLVPDRGDGLRGSCRGAPPPHAQRAVTHVEVVLALAGATHVRCRLETGRTHQIRIHLAEAGTALVGEEVYIRDHRGPRLPAPRQMLHARELGFAHPRDGRPLLFVREPPADFMATLAALRVGRSSGAS